MPGHVKLAAQRARGNYIMGSKGNSLGTPEYDENQRLGARRVQHAQLTYNGFSLLMPVPQHGDDLETTFKKVHGLADAVANGGTLTLPTTQTSAAFKQQDAEAAAKERMSTLELKSYEAWKVKKFTLPFFDWAEYKDSVPPEGLETFTQRAAAMDVVWQRQGTSPSHAVWLSTRMGHLVPLVKAVEKVLKAQAQLEQQSCMSGLSEKEMAEVEMLQHIQATIDANVARERQRVKQQAKSIYDSVAVLKGQVKDRGK